ncbi:laminin subunit beta-2-like isoform X1 [Ornithorhynchus anatinus]|uniref:Laminin subunit beta-1 n=1 Tax=Ornithorhynchus anatinus TaxID=9258 RepID=A0A6I8N5C3_ORNAN|nr:laminin subunit beta-2-like isoform X1 [Ornithorhynchus anatinus]
MGSSMPGLGGHGPSLLSMEVLLLLLVKMPNVPAQELPDLLHPGCSEGSCYPATGNLLIGRARSLSATSTCGLHGPQEYCIVSHLQDSEKCFYCDSRMTGDRAGHRIENVIYLSRQDGEKTWWQSENGVEDVSIRLDLDGEFHFTHLIMKFKTFRPAALLIERSADSGRSWKVYRYFAYNCSKLFPGVPTAPGIRVSDLVCDQRYSDIEPSSQGEVIFKVLDPAIQVDDPYNQEIQDLLQITNLRVNFSKLHTLGDNLLDGRPQGLRQYYYALYELVVRGSCFCHGHASECAPAPGVPPGSPGMIHGLCVCKHRTSGPHCERCQDFHHDRPWRPAEPSDPHICRECECNQHSRSCHFDMAVFLASGNVSGGVCDGCQHNTMGQHCQLCRPFYYRDPRADLRSPVACRACDCDPAGSLDGGVCDGRTDVALGLIAGQCRCKVNVWGQRCDSCRQGFYGLSQANPLGCQPCRCDPQGTVAGSAPCDHVSGECYCKRFVTGRFCGQCLPEFWGLSNDLAGCRPCTCDFGGAYSNRCSREDGLCPCRPHLSGRRCHQLQSGYYCATLDQAKYEAEHAQGHPPTDPLLPGAPRPEAPSDCPQDPSRPQSRHRPRLRRQRSPTRSPPSHSPARRSRQLLPKPDVEPVPRERVGTAPTWTGPGFARVRDGAGLSFHIHHVPLALGYDILLRYEPQSSEDWEAIVSVRASTLPTSPRCGNVLPSEQLYHEALPHRHRYVVLARPFCFEPGTHYEVVLRVQRAGVTQWHPEAYILLDSLVLLPRVLELPGLRTGDPGAAQRHQDMERYRCLEAFRMVTLPVLAESCAELLCSISALLHDGALSCQCDLQGSTSTECAKLGGQCQCKANVIGRRCNQCAPGTFGFGPTGCSECRCSPEGATSRFCDPVSGQCQCRLSIMGRQCDRCQPGQWGFPQCRPCQCNGHAEECHPHTGACQDCRDATAGRHCERCLDGYYGDPVLGSGQQCRPCPCPGYPGSRHYHGSSCQADGHTGQIVCLCAPGYAGSRCDRCSAGYFGRPVEEGGDCRPCQCNNNIDPSDPAACEPRSGQCQRCLHNTQGPRCAHCRPGYYGNALQRSCRRCTCNLQGTVPTRCPLSGPCYCDRITGHCSCRPHVLGRNCDRCAPNFWNFGGTHGCEPCSCHPTRSLHLSCNTFTGQCHCRAGFGGRTCSHCQEGYWGDPELECRACDCDPRGSESLQCHRLTGRCSCREGFTGSRCSVCTRGFQDSFPHCPPCHPCFTHWDQQLGLLRKHLAWLNQEAEALRLGGPGPEVSSARLRSLEEQLRQVQGLLGAGHFHETQLQPLTRQLDNFRREVAALGLGLLAVEQHMVSSNLQVEGQQSRLGKLARELNHLNGSATRLWEQFRDAVEARTSETIGHILAAAQASRDAERQTNTSLQGPNSALGQAHSTRRQTEQLLQQTEKTLRRGMAAQRTKLQGLLTDTKALSIFTANQRICGARGEKGCALSPCGGAECRDSLGRRHCGGPNCPGALPVSLKALGTAQNVSRALGHTTEQLGQLAHQLLEIQAVARAAQTQAEETLSRAQAARGRAGKGTAQLLDFIQRIRLFLMEEGADPESIELVARQVLAISLPSSPEEVGHLLEEIRDSLRSLDGVDRLLNSTARAMASAQGLLERGQQAREWAEGVKGTIMETQGTLEMTRKSMRAAEQVLRKAKQALRGVESRVREVDRKLQQVTWAVDMDTALEKLSREVANLQTKMADNRKLAQAAEGKAGHAASTAKKLGKDMQMVKQRYMELQGQVGSLGGGMNKAWERARQVQHEAQELLRKVSGSKTQLEGLEKRFERNEKELEEKVSQLQTLEKQVSGLLEHIRQEANAYATC